MQRIERYGVIALVLLLVTIAAVSFWDDGAAKPERNTESDTVAAREARREKRAPRSAQNVRIGDAALPETAESAGTRARPAQADDAAERAKPKRSWLSRRSGRRSNEPAFETLPATRVESDDSDEVEFPTELAQRHDPRPETRGARPIESASAREFGAGAEEKERTATREARRQPEARRSDERAKPVASAGSYTVRAGDTLSQIAERTLGSSRRWGEIQALNGGLDPSALHVGQVLTLPGAGAGTSLRPVARETSIAVPPPAAGDGYVVRAGDSLSQIAQDQLGGASRWREIVALNPGLDPDRLLVGQSLRLPGGARSSPGALDPRTAGLVSYADPATRGSKKKNRVR